MLFWAATALAQPQLKIDQMAGDSCACQNGGALQASLLVNGNFSAGNTGFSSGLSPNIPCSAGQFSMGLIDYDEWSRTQAQITLAILEMSR